MVGRSIRRAVYAGLLSAIACPAAAQSTRDEWLALRTAKQARHHRITPRTDRNVLTITTIRFHPDPAGNLVGVGEARNDSAFPLTYARINFRFFDSSGTDLGGEWAYLHGGVNARIPSNNRYESVLAPGRTGFFKVWTAIPASAMASHTAASAGESIPFLRPLASMRFDYWPANFWYSLVSLQGSRTPVGQRLSGTVLNGDPVNLFDEYSLPNILTYSVRVSVAAFQDGAITDVQSVLAVGPQQATLCNETVTGMPLHWSAGFTINLARPANSIGNQSVEWEELGASPDGFFVPDGGAQRSFSVARQCGWTAVPTVPWISVTERDQNTGRVTFSVERNFTTQRRVGGIDVSGLHVAVGQEATCPTVVSPATVFLGPGKIVQTASSVNVNAPSGCSWTPNTDAPWLRAFRDFGNNMKLSTVDPNLTGTIRSATVIVGTSSVTVYQLAGSRSVDFNEDGSLDLLWHHRSDGRLATWRMNGTRMIDGTLLTPGQVPDTNWTPVGAGDLDRTGTTDILWQNDADGRLAYWRMSGTAMLEGRPISAAEVDETQPPDLRHKIRALSDFNRDGDPDIVWQHEGTGEVTVWFMRTTFTPWGGSSPMQVGAAALGPGRVPDLNWKIAGSGDFNRDGWSDLVWRHQGDGSIAVWEMHGTTLARGDLVTPGRVVDLNWRINGVGDINGDDWPDLLWQHRVTGEVGAWLMNGTRMVSGVSLGVVPDTNWQIVAPR